MTSISNIELDEFDELEFGLTPASSSLPKSDSSNMLSTLDVLKSKQPPPLRIGGQLQNVPKPASATKLPMDGLFDDDDDDLLPKFDSKQSTGFPSSDKSSSRTESVQNSIPTQKSLTSILKGPSVGQKVSDKPPSVSFGPVIDTKGPATSSGSLTGRDGFGAGGDSPISTGFAAKTPVKSSLFKNLPPPIWEKAKEAEKPKEPATIEQPALSNSAASAAQQKMSMLFGGSAAASNTKPSETTTPAPSTFHTTSSTALSSVMNSVVSELMQESKVAEEEELKRVSAQHDLIRQQTQQAVQLQQAQLDQFLRQFMSENKKQLETHIQRIRSGYPLLGSVPLETAAPDGDSMRKTQLLERRLEERDNLIEKYSNQMMELEERHRSELREMRRKHEDDLQRAAALQHEMVSGLQSSQEMIRTQYEDSLNALKEALNAKTGIDVVKQSMERSSEEFSAWKSDFERRQEALIREKDNQIASRDRQISELSTLLQSQIDTWRTERESLQRRIDQETARALKKESEYEDQLYNLQREKMEFEAEKTRIRNQQARELQRLEKRMEEVLAERQSVLESLTEERHSVESEKRNLKETIRGIEEKCALELKKKQLNLESAMEHVAAEQKVVAEKSQSLDRERGILREERERIERDKMVLVETKMQYEEKMLELRRREQEVEDAFLRASKIKQEGERSLNEARYIEEEHKTRVANLNVFLEQLRQKELDLMRKAVGASVLNDRTAVQLSNGAVALVPSSRNVASSLKIQLLPNPAADYERKSVEEEKEYLKNLKSSSPWFGKS